MNPNWNKKIWEMRKIPKSDEITKTDEETPVVSLVKVENKTYQLLFLSRGCEYACTFCNYGFDYNLTAKMVMPELKKINLNEFDIYELELEANGSFLSEREIPYDLFLEILQFVSNKNIPVITMETHYKTITEKKLQDIRRILGQDQEISFELGLESVNEDVRSNIYNKDIDITKYLEVARLCEKYKIRLQINVLLGAPFLSREEQIQDSLDTLKFIFKEMPKGTYAVLFPINIKNDTMIKYWQDIGIYDQISSWEFVELLHRIPKEYLGSFTIAWWGNRENAFTKGEIQHPKTCKKCKGRLMDFYKKIYCDWDPLHRKELIESCWSTRCDCDR